MGVHKAKLSVWRGPQRRQAADNLDNANQSCCWFQVAHVRFDAAYRTFTGYFFPEAVEDKSKEEAEKPADEA